MPEHVPGQVTEQQHRVAIVIGGASGIGAAWVVASGRTGTVVVADLPGTACDVEVNVSDEALVAALMDGVMTSHGG